MRIMISILCLLFFATSVTAQTEDNRSTGQKVKEGIKDGYKGVKKGIKKGAHEVAEQASELKSDVTDKEVENKTGPDGQDIFLSDDGRYYYVDDKGHHVYVEAGALRNKPLKKADD